MVHPNLGAEEVDGMTVFTDVGGFNMLWIFSCGNYAIVAAGAVCGYRVMVKGCRAPGVAGVAVLTHIIALDVLCMFAGGNVAIVAAGTATQHLVVVHPNLGAEEIDGMAILTDVSGFNVLWVLA